MAGDGGYNANKLRASPSMTPKFKTLEAWEQAEILMQPAFIRVIDNIRKELDVSVWRGSYEELDTPYPGYLLCLTYEERSVKVDIWELCFQVCFQDYIPSDPDGQEVTVDSSLLEREGAVDWHSLESKAQKLVKQVFANLPGPTP